MTELIVSLFMTISFLLGVLLRYIPLKSVLTDRQNRILFWSYTAAAALNVVVMTLVFSVNQLNVDLLKMDLHIFSIVTTLINIAVLPKRTKEILFTYGIVMTCSYLTTFAPALATELITGLGGTGSYVVGVLAYLLSLGASYWPIRILLHKTVKPFLSVDSSQYWKTSWFIPLAIYISILMGFPDEVHTETIGHIISRLLIGAAMVMMCLDLAKGHKLLMEQKTMEKQLQNQKLLYAQMQQHVEDARRNAHDFKHFLSAVEQYVERNDREGLARYCEGLDELIQKDYQIPYTGNTAADGILYRYMRLCIQSDIRFSYAGSVKNVGIRDMDLCMLLGNALDNAYHACSKLPENRKIHVVFRTEENLFSILVQNSFDGAVLVKGEQLLSRKRENEAGLGIQSMRSVCQRYQGQLQLSWEENTFTLLAMLTPEA